MADRHGGLQPEALFRRFEGLGLPLDLEAPVMTPNGVIFLFLVFLSL